MSTSVESWVFLSQGLSGKQLYRFALHETLNAFVESVHLDQLRTSDFVLGPGRKFRVATAVKVEDHHLRRPVAPHIKRLPRTQALEQIKLLVAELEQLAVVLAVEGCVR